MMETMEQADSQLEQASNAIEAGDSQAAAVALEEAQETLTAEAERLAEETAPTPEQSTEIAALTARVEQLERLILAQNSQVQAEELEDAAEEVAAEVSQEEPEQVEGLVVNQVEEATPAAQLRSRLKNGWLSPLKRHAQ